MKIYLHTYSSLGAFQILRYLYKSKHLFIHHPRNVQKQTDEHNAALDAILIYRDFFWQQADCWC